MNKLANPAKDKDSKPLRMKRMDARKIKPISNYGKCPRRRKWFAYSPTYCTEGGCPESKKCPFPDEYGKPLKK